MEVKFEDITDQQCADIIAHFAKRKMVGDIKEIVIHSGNDDIIITKKPRLNGGFDDTLAAAVGAAACCAIIPPISI